MYSNNINITNGDKKFTYYFEYVDKKMSYDDIHFKYQS
jgi:hypothetical protein